ncbi:MAG: hypothetical protein ABIN96_00805 [Rubrivivax sp.]
MTPTTATAATAATAVPGVTGQRGSVRRLLATAALCLLPALGVQARDTPDAIPLDTTFNATEQAAKLFTVAQGQAMQGVKKVAVPLFSVEFVTGDNERAETSGFAAAGRSSAAIYYQLKGVDETDFQAITTALYQRFLTDLATAGFEVLTQDQVAASPTYRSLAASGTPSPIKSDGAITLAPPGMAIYGFNKEQSGGSSNSKSLFGALSKLSAGFSAVGAVMDTPKLQQELGAALIEVQMKVNFVKLSNGNRGFLGRLSNTASVGGKVEPTITSAIFSVQSSTRGALTLSNPLTLDPAAFSEVRDKPTTAGDTAGAVAVGLLRLALNSKDSSSTQQLEAVADPARYREVVTQGLGTVAQMFVQRLKAGE